MKQDRGVYYLKVWGLVVTGLWLYLKSMKAIFIIIARIVKYYKIVYPRLSYTDYVNNISVG